MTSPGDAPANLPEFIDFCLDRYMRSASFRSALHREAPGQAGRPQRGGICPPWHRHAATTFCYQGHGCRCEACRAAMSKHQKTARIRRAQREWRQRNNEEMRTA